jgi:hypothetical protein
MRAFVLLALLGTVIACSSSDATPDPACDTCQGNVAVNCTLDYCGSGHYGPASRTSCGALRCYVIEGSADNKCTGGGTAFMYRDPVVECSQ